MGGGRGRKGGGRQIDFGTKLHSPPPVKDCFMKNMYFYIFREKQLKIIFFESLLDVKINEGPWLQKLGDCETSLFP